MKRSKNIVHCCSLAGRLMLLAALFLLGGCAAQQLGNPMPPRLLHADADIQIEDVDVLAVSPEMEAFLDRYVLEYSNSQTRLHLLTSAVISNGVLGFDYEESSTLSAIAAFEKRMGNCIGFANMMIALARRAGLKASYQEVFRRPEWSMDEDTVLLVKHVNVVVESTNHHYVMDVSGLNIDKNARRQLVSDSYAKALYLNNLGAEALLENDLPTAYAYMIKAIETEPLLTDSWVNLGVVFGRNEQLDAAEVVLKRALEIDSSQFSAMSNLYEVYVELGDMAAAQNIQARVERYRRNNPYYLLRLSEVAVELDQYEESISLLQRAIRKKEDDHLLYFALAKTQYLSGERSAAENSLVRARELAPDDVLAHYARPLNELVAER